MMQEKQLSLSIFFPAYNEEGNIESLVRNTLAFLDRIGAEDAEVLVVDDGSRDRTAHICAELAKADVRLRFVSHEKNRGYGAAVKTGLKSCRKDYVFFTDGDGQFDINELETFLPRLKEYDMVIGYRKNRQDNAVRKLNAAAWGMLMRALFKLRVRDIDCAFKVFKRLPLCSLFFNADGALISTELLCRANQLGYRILQLPVNHFPRKAGRQTGANPKVILRAFSELFRLYAKIRKPVEKGLEIRG
jgi:glycosyltransferase involved in cell wall biosynthesis